MKSKPLKISARPLIGWPMRDKVEPLGNSDTAVTALHRFNRIGAGQYHNVAADCPGADVNKPIRQKLDKVKPGKREKYQQEHMAELAAFDTAADFLKGLKESGQFVVCGNLAVNISLLRSDAPSLHLTGGNAHVDGGDFLNA